jgi:hypothetical protein
MNSSAFSSGDRSAVEHSAGTGIEGLSIEVGALSGDALSWFGATLRIQEEDEGSSVDLGRPRAHKPPTTGVRVARFVNEPS